MESVATTMMMGDPVRAQHDRTAARTTLPRVLVVDDEPLARQSMRGALRERADVVTASSFEEARELLAGDEHWDALIIDVLLNIGHTGLELLALVRPRWPNTPVAVVTGALQTSWVNTIDALDAKLLTKPFPPEQLREFVRRVAAGMTRVAPPVAVPEPATSDEVESLMKRPRQTITQCIEVLRGLLLARRQDWRTWYAVGRAVAELKRVPERYGIHAVANAARELRVHPVKLYRRARVAERWSEADVSCLLAQPTLSWWHLVALAPVESAPLRQALLQAALNKAWSVRQLARAIRRVAPFVDPRHCCDVATLAEQVGRLE